MSIDKQILNAAIELSKNTIFIKKINKLI